MPTLRLEQVGSFHSGCLGVASITCGAAAVAVSRPQKTPTWGERSEGAGCHPCGRVLAADPEVQESRKTGKQQLASAALLRFQFWLIRLDGRK